MVKAQHEPANNRRGKQKGGPDVGQRYYFQQTHALKCKARSKDVFQQGKVIVPIRGHGPADVKRADMAASGKSIDEKAHPETRTAACTTHLVGDLAFVTVDEEGRPACTRRATYNTTSNARDAPITVRTAVNDLRVGQRIRFVGVVNTMALPGKSRGKPNLATINCAGTDQITNTGKETIYCGDLVVMDPRPTVATNFRPYIDQPGYPATKLRPTVRSWRPIDTTSVKTLKATIDKDPHMHGIKYIETLLRMVNEAEAGDAEGSKAGDAEGSKAGDAEGSKAGDAAGSEAKSSHSETLVQSFNLGIKLVAEQMGQVIGRALSTARPGENFDIILKN